MEYDIHLSAENISADTIKKLQVLGYKRDTFSNNRRCETVAFHASYKEHLSEPNNELWENTINLLENDQSFRGCLEEETFSKSKKYGIIFNPNIKPITLPPFKFQKIEVGKHKVCDIHMAIDFSNSSEEAIAKIESLNMVSFDRPLKNNKTGFARVYSLTFENYEYGEKVFDQLKFFISSIKNLKGKIKIEKITRFKTHPADAHQLPIVKNEFVEKWIKLIEGNK